jgi:hypothetical protein
MNDETVLDPREAAALLEQTTREARRGFDRRPSWIVPIAAGVVLVCYGVVWLSVRDQHPYRGPAGWALGVLYGTIVAWAVLNGVVLRRATAGVGGRASRQHTLEGLAFAAIWICVYVVQGALVNAGVGKGLAYGIWPAAAPLFIVGSAAAGYCVAQGKQAAAGFAVAAVALGSIACFAGPVAVWGVIAVGLSTLLLAAWGAQQWQSR